MVNLDRETVSLVIATIGVILQAIGLHQNRTKRKRRGQHRRD